MGPRTIIKHGLLLVAPFALILGTVALVDPYGMFPWQGPVPVELKKKNLYHDGRTMPFSNTLWKLIAFRKQPVKNILLGDSRLSHFDLGHLRDVSERNWFNFGVPGGNYRTVEDLFNYADSIAPLERVMVQVSFRGCNQGFDWDLYMEPRVLVDDPLLYLTNRRVIEATGLGLISRYFPDRLAYDAIPEDQWTRVLKSERENAEHYAFDPMAFERLRSIADRCRKKGIALVLVEYPTHPDVRRIYHEAGLDSLRQEYVSELRAMAPFIDLDRDGLFPDDTSNWRDPMHLTTATQRLLIDKVWGADRAVFE
jgi:hypothetical protein